jgi:hypothetical protein
MSNALRVCKPEMSKQCGEVPKQEEIEIGLVLAAMSRKIRSKK